MANEKFDMAKALEGVHEYAHALGGGFIPHAWRSGEMNDTWATNDIFFSGLEDWLGSILHYPPNKIPYHMTQFLKTGKPESYWWARDANIGTSVRRTIFYGNTIVGDIGMGPGDREFQFNFHNGKVLLVELWCVNMAHHVGLMPFDPMLYIKNATPLSGGDGVEVDKALCCASKSFYVVDEEDSAFFVVWRGRHPSEAKALAVVGRAKMKAVTEKAHPVLKGFSMRMTVNNCGYISQVNDKLFATVTFVSSPRAQSFVNRQPQSLWTFL